MNAMTLMENLSQCLRVHSTVFMLQQSPSCVYANTSRAKHSGQVHAASTARANLRGVTSLSLGQRCKMKRVLTAVACGGCLVAPSRGASWDGASATRGAGGAWPSVPPGARKREDLEHPSARDPQAPGDALENPRGDGNFDERSLDENVHPSPYPQSGTVAAGGGAYYENDVHDHDGRSQAFGRGDPFEPQQPSWSRNQHEAPSPQQHEQHQHHYHPQHQHQQWLDPNQHGQGGQRDVQQYDMHNQVRNFHPRGRPQHDVPGAGEPPRLGTKWRSIVTRVKDAVRPGEPFLPHPPSGFAAGQGGGSWGGEQTSDGGAQRYNPPGSSWVHGMHWHHQGTSPSKEFKAQTGQQDFDAHGGIQQYRPGQSNHPYRPPNDGVHGLGTAASGYDSEFHADLPLENVGSTGRVQHTAHAEPSELDEGGSWIAHPPPEAVMQPHADTYADSDVRDGRTFAPDIRSASGTSRLGYHAEEDRNMPGRGSGTFAETSGKIGMEEALFFPRAQETGYVYEPPPPPPPSSLSPPEVGQGWAIPTAHDALTSTQRQEGDEGYPGEGDERKSVCPDSFKAEIAEATDGAEGQLAASTRAALSASAWSDDHRQSSEGTGGTSLASPLPVNQTTTLERPKGATVSKANPSAETGATGHIGNSRTFESAGEALCDTIPTSVDHGSEQVDWGTGEKAREDRIEAGQSGGNVVFPEGHERRLEQERDEEALIRELERMDGFCGEEPLQIGDRGTRDGSHIQLPEQSRGHGEQLQQQQQQQQKEEGDSAAEGQGDAGLEHQLDVLFDSILDDEDAIVLAAPDQGAAADQNGAKTVFQSSSPCSLPRADAGASAHSEAIWDDPPTLSGKSKVSHAHEAVASDDGRPIAQNSDAAGDTLAAEVSAHGRQSCSEEVDAEEDCAKLSSAADVVEEDDVASMWGKTDRWASLPPPHVINERFSEDEERRSESEPADESDDDKDQAGVRMLLDPMELPPSAATDEIWNDQHLQDQLDAYWEQSRRSRDIGSGSAGGGNGLRSSAGVRQLSSWGAHLQPAYGPGDWVGKGSPMVQEPLREGSDGLARMVQEPLPGGTDGITSDGWVAPRLLQGNQAPINIYGNVHVHLQSSQETPKGGASSQAASARERYYSQGETSWSASERGGQQRWCPPSP